MNPSFILLIILIYFVVLYGVSYFTSRKADNQTFFSANKKSPWYLVAYGMIGASLSGVTFISIPGWVGQSQFSYMQVVLGYFAGYMVIAHVLLPLYYRLNLTTIYGYLEQRFGLVSYQTGAMFFIISRVVGASFRMFLMAGVLHHTVFEHFGIPFYATAFISVFLIWVYTAKGGIKTIIYTDLLQTTFMLVAVLLTIGFIALRLDFGWMQIGSKIMASNYSQIFFFDDFKNANFFWKQFFSGMFITIVMTGLDQDMMQKNLTCRNIGDAKKNMMWFSALLVPVNFIFLMLGALLYMYVDAHAIHVPAKADMLYPFLATGGEFPYYIGIIFILGLVAAAYSSADGALTALTTSFSIDILRIDKKHDTLKQVKIRKQIHILFSVILALSIVIFNEISDDSVIKSLLDAAGYTYGPLLGLFAFGLLTKYKIRENLVIPILVSSPFITFAIKFANEHFNNSYQIGFELLIINGLITFIGLWLIRISLK